MVLAVAFFAAMDAGMKALTPHHSPMQIACLRGAFAWPFVVLWLWRTAQFTHLLQARWSLHLLRAVLGITMLWAFVFSLQTLGLADAYAIFFAAPFIITLLSAWFLKEYVAPRHYVVLVIGFAAILYMLKPDAERWFSLGALAALLAAFCYSVSAITVRVLARTDSAGNMVFWLMTLLTLGAGVLALPQWQPIQQALWPIYLIVGVCGFLGQITITEAFRIAPAAVVAPFEYTALLWGIGFDIVVWQQYPGSSVIIGSSVIMLCGLYLLWQQRRLSHR
ncbi:membrane protein [Alishewanella tabrizica]|uniref:Membrane protein n=2 Tax=Alishewanella tabrizica TaxID=671278 RepID=A0ABQ2WD64_9ALTE|nr:membrane protein [Alishewanella tabrizica]